jgi:group II intron reverse transcriptase/maturase
MCGTKPFVIDKWTVKKAFEKVKQNRGTYGIDEQSIKDFEENLKDNLYKVWNRMSSGTYFPKPVKAVKIPKKAGGYRVLGIPTVEDRVAQMVAKIYFEPNVEPIFYEDSYGYRPGKSAINAVGATRERCWKYRYVLEFDIKGLFDNIRHDYLTKMVERHTKEQWVTLYVKRWLEVPFQMSDGTKVQRKAGTPQGGVISPVLANLYMHYAFDSYMIREHPKLKWARYADDGVVHCHTKNQAQYIIDRLVEQFAKFGLELNLEKTRIVRCSGGSKGQERENNSFTFLGYTFRPREARGKEKYFTSFLPAISDKAKEHIRHEVWSWKLQRKVGLNLEKLAEQYNPKIRGWINYYKHFYPSELKRTLQFINRNLLKWVKRKFKRISGNKAANKWLDNVSKTDTNLFAHWVFGVTPMAG